MDYFFLPTQRDRLLRNFHPFEDWMPSHWGYPFDIFDEEFHSVEFPFPLTKRHVSFLVPQGRYFQRKKEGADEKDKKEADEGTEKDKEVVRSSDDKSDTKSDDIKEKAISLPSRDLNNFMPLEEIFPFLGQQSSLWKTSEGGPFEVNVNLRGYDPDKVKIEIKEGILKVEGKHESPDGSFTYVRHEQSIPKDVSSETLKATLLPEGILRLRQAEQSHTIPITYTAEDKKEKSKSPEKEMTINE